MASRIVRALLLALACVSALRAPMAPNPLRALSSALRMRTGPEGPIAQLQIQYCGGCGFDQYYFDLVEALQRRFPDQLELSFVRDPQETGNFEVTLLSTNQLVHSKARKGMGLCVAGEERERLFQVVDLYLEFAKRKRK